MLKHVFFTFTAIAFFLGSTHHALGHDHDHDHGPGQLEYVENLGQWDVEVQFRADISDATMFITNSGITWVRLEDGAGDRFHDEKNNPKGNIRDLTFNAHAWQIELLNANTDAQLLGQHRYPHYRNYFLGDDPDRWKGNVRSYPEVLHNNVWPGIDLKWYGANSHVKYDVLLAAGADHRDIQMAYQGLEQQPYINANGELVVSTSVGEMLEMRPVAWYADDHSHLACEYVIKDGAVGFAFPDGRENDRAVVIDPLLMGATYSGMVGPSVYGHCSTFDEDGNIYGGGQVFGAGFPTTLGAFQAAYGGGWGTDIGVNKFSPDATALIWATYLGGDEDDKPHSLIVNAAQELSILGSSEGSDYPTTANAFQPNFQGGSYDIVVSRLSADATSLVGSTFLGGSADDGRQSFNMTINYGDTYRGEIMLDAADNIFIASFTQSNDYPTSPGAYQGTLAGAQDAVVTGLSPDCSSLVWSSFLGGSSDDSALGLRFNSVGDLYVTGGTQSADFPSIPGGWQGTYQGGDKDGFIVKFENAGTTLGATTFFGTNEEDMSFFIDLDTDDDVYIYGQSEGGIAITPPGTFGTVGGNIFVAQFTPDLATTVFTTTLGPIGSFSYSLAPVAFLVDVCDHIYISGYNPSGTWPTTPDALYGPGSSQFYLAAYDVDMSGLLFGSYYGGSHVDGGTSRFDKNGIVYQGVCSGGNSMPTSPGAFAPTNNVSWDLGVFKIDFQVAGVNAAGAGTINQGCAPIQIDFLNTSTGDHWIWDFGDGSPVDTSYAPSHTYTTPGTFDVTLIAMDSLSCNLADTIVFPVTIGQAQPITAAFTALPDADCTQFTVSTTNNSTGTPLAFEWQMGDGTQYSDTNVVHNYAGVGAYDIQLIAYDPTGCSQPDTVMQTINILPPDTIEVDFSVTQTPDCDDLLVETNNNSTGPSPNFQWDMGDGTLLNGQDVSHIYLGAGTYDITLVGIDSNTCNISDTLTLQVQVDPVVPVLADILIDQVFDCGQLLVEGENLSSGTFMEFSWNMGDGTVLTDTNITHTYSNPGTYDVSMIVTDLLGCSPNDTAFAQLVVEALDPVVAEFTVEQTGDCSTLTVEALNMSSGDSLAYDWDMGDGTLLSDTNVNHVYTSPGVYDITLAITDLACGLTDQMVLQVELTNTIPTPLVNEAVVCYGDSAVLDATTAEADTYLWSTGEDTPTIIVAQGGIYTVEVFNDHCMGSDTVEVLEGQLLDLAFSVDACPNANTALTIPYNGTAYEWQNGSTDQTTIEVGAGNYGFTVWDDLGCAHRDTATIVPLDAEAQIYAPNAFSPDGDGVNDVFLLKGYGEEVSKVEIFNRWGELIYTGNSLAQPWDGRYKGELVKQDVYVYKLEYNDYCQTSEKTTVFGHVTVVR